jgi:hypothetical protein
MFSAASVLAQETAPGRYTMTPSGQDMLRLDTKTGAVSLCARQAGNWICKSVADDQVALQNEIDRLSIENEQLRAKLAQAGLEAPPVTTPQPDDPRSWMPSDRQVEEFKSFFEKMMRRFRQLAEDMQGDASPDRP